MKKTQMLGIALMLCTIFVGCSSDSHESLVKNTIDEIGSTQILIRAIREGVEAAIKENKDSGKPLNLEPAAKKTKELKKRVEEFQKIRGRIERAKAAITDDQKKEFAEKKRDEMRDNIQKLLEQNALLQKALGEAEKIDKPATDKLREQIRDAEGPFEAINRQ
jgi:hypothetical protein